MQDAWIAIRRSKRFRKTYLRIARKKGGKKAIVAVARKILTSAFYMLQKREEFNENA